MRTKIIRGLALIGAGFAVLFGLRLGWGYLSHPDGAARRVEQASDLSGFELEKRNYASAKIARKVEGGGAAAMDQKYERVADVRAHTRDFEREEAALRAAAAAQQGVIQLEQKDGVAGGRVLHLAIGVDPARFDALVEQVRAVGATAYLHVEKQDRTNEFKQLEARRTSLEAARDALIGLKGRSGTIEELVALEDRILDVHQQLQQLGVSLGEFDEVNELCTVKVTLAEQGAPVTYAGQVIPLWRRAEVAFRWALPVYLRLLGTVLCGALVVLVLLVLGERVGALQKIVARVEPPRPPAG
ncbi:MAG: DUF4349 domain-containing protein [Kofleriaceae bacterium]|nr:DUF4349 domain-containing protein [Myxococcales bacterium]MCB9559676.1 DUF4349 domain-containing protein [Kofleriaceae bacterium]